MQAWGMTRSDLEGAAASLLARPDLATADVGRDELAALLSLEGAAAERLFARAREVKERHVGRRVYFRGLVELSNVCRKSCLYCGVRASNAKVERYTLDDDEVVEAALFARRERLASIVIQGGERQDAAFAERIERLLRRIHAETAGALRVTLSLGEQSGDTLARWRDAGATRYLLRIETSSPALYATLHPRDGRHSHPERLAALDALRRLGYQTGTGVMVGLPGQAMADLADDLLFFREGGFPMFGLGPYLEHEDAPLPVPPGGLRPREERLFLSLKMIAVLRLLVPDANIAATTAMQAVHPMGRERALRIAANVVMPNLTPARYRPRYFLYDGKPCATEDGGDCLPCLAQRIAMAGGEPAWGEWGDSARLRRPAA